MEDSPPIKVVMIGSTRVGKTTLVTRWTEDRFEKNHNATVGAAFKVVSLELGDGVTRDMHIWDTAGQDTFKTTTSIYCRGAKGAMVVFDITDRQSFDDVPGWLQTLSDKVEVPFILIGNKADLADQRAVSFDEASAFANSHNVPYFETSAVTNYNIDEAFNELANVATKEEELSKPTVETTSSSTNQQTSTTQPQTVDITKNGSDDDKKKKGGCC